MLTDTHCHIQLAKYDADRAEVLRRAAEAGVETLLCVGYDPDSWRRAQRLVGDSGGGSREAVAGDGQASDSGHTGSRFLANRCHVYATAGLHPHDAKDLTPELLLEIRDLCASGKCVAVGECGLDFYRNLSTPEQQRDAFVAQIELAAELDLPLIVHDREAHESVIDLLRRYGARRGVMHCFSGDWDLAKQCLDLGFYISIAGPITFQNAVNELREVARRVPADRLVVETDSPFLTPHPFRGKRNEPAMVRLVAEEVARLRGEDPRAFAAQTTANAKELFGSG